MDWLKEYGAATFGMIAAAWLAGYAGFNLGASERLQQEEGRAQIITGSTKQAPSVASPHID